MSLKPTDKRVIIANLEGQLSKNKVIVVIHVQIKYGMYRCLCMHWDFEVLKMAPNMVVSLEPLNYHQNVASRPLFYRYYFGKCLTWAADLVNLPHFFCSLFAWVAITRTYKDSYTNSFSPSLAN